MKIMQLGKGGLDRRTPVGARRRAGTFQNISSLRRVVPALLAAVRRGGDLPVVLHRDGLRPAAGFVYYPAALRQGRCFWMDSCRVVVRRSSVKRHGGRAADVPPKKSRDALPRRHHGFDLR